MKLTPLTHGELFAGISGFGLGFEQAGIETLWHVEKDTDCQAVLRYHYPDSLILPDIRQAGKDHLPYVDIISMGFPCQGLSVAGKRAGLADERSGLFFEGLRVIYELQPLYAIWENVPGLLTSCSCRKCRRRCAKCGTIAGAEDSTCDLCGNNEFRGRVLPEHRGADFFTVISSFGFIGFDGAWTLFDSQYFGVPQRRRRLFGVFAQRHIGAGSCTEILSFVTRSGGNPTPSKKEGQSVAAKITKRFGGASNQRPPINEADNLVIAHSVRPRSGMPQGWNSNLIVGDNGQGDPNGEEGELAYALNGQVNQGVAIAATLRSGGNGNVPSSRGENLVVGSQTAHHGRNNPDSQPLVVGFDQRKGQYTGDIAAPLRVNGAVKPGANNGKPDNMCVLIQPTVGSLQAHSKRHGHAMGTQQAAEEGHLVVTNTFNGYTGGSDDNDAQGHHQVVALAWQQGVSENDRSYPVRAGDYAGSISESRVDAVAGSFGVRRLTPVECERLQGFPDGWTEKGFYTDGLALQSDSARYRQLGNAVTVKVTKWIGRRIKKAALLGG